MLPRIIEARHVEGQTIWLRFADGSEGEVDLRNELDGEVFEPLKDMESFKQFTLHPQLRIVVWPIGADFAPAFLRAAVRIAA